MVQKHWYLLYWIPHNKKIDDYDIDSVNPLYLIANTAHGHIEEKNGNRYLVFDSTDKNKKVLSKYAELWDGVKNLIEKIDDKPDKYVKDFMKIRFESNDDLPLNKLSKFHVLTLIVRCIFKEDKYYLQLFDECLHELQKYYIWRTWS